MSIAAGTLTFLTIAPREGMSMAKVKNLHTGNFYHLLPHHRIGRFSPSVDSVINLPEVSNIHMDIRWRWHEEKKHNAWFIKDDSTNGTWLSGEKLARNIDAPLEVQHIIALGKEDNRLLEVIDLDAPEALLVNLSDQSEIVLKAYNLLPHDGSQWVFWQESESRQWRCKAYSDETDNDEEGDIVTHGQTLIIGKQQWRVFLPSLITPTTVIKSAQSIRQFDVLCKVSRDEESVEVSLLCGTQKLYLKEKVFFLLLVYLVRKKIDDTNIEEEEQGWVHNAVVQRELGLSDTHINIYIHRMRAYFAAQLDNVLDQEIILQRRRGSMRVGLDVVRLNVKGGQSYP